MIFTSIFNIPQTNFPDGTLCLRLPDGAYDYIKGNDRITIRWQYQEDSELFALQCLVDKIRDLNPLITIDLELPYIPHARMDRVHLDDCFTLKTFCKVINNMNFYEVWVLDPHSDVSVALLNNCRVTPTRLFETPADKIMRAENTVVMYPDLGAAKKFSTIIQQSYVSGMKTRDWNTGKIVDYQLIIPDGIDIKGKDILIVDDICSKGYTFLCAARALKRAGAKEIYLFVDHCENSVLEGEMINANEITKIFTTDSIFTKHHPKISVTPIN